MELGRSNFMLSKRNYQEKLRKMEPRQERFSIRKFSIGAASVLIGLSFMSMTGNQKVQAAEQQEKPAVVQNAKDNEQSPSSAKATLADKVERVSSATTANKTATDSKLTQSPIQESSKDVSADTKMDSDSSKTTTANDKVEQTKHEDAGDSQTKHEDAGGNNVSTQTTTPAINNTNTNGSQSRDKAGDSDVSTQTTTPDLNRDKKVDSHITLFLSLAAVPPAHSSQSQENWAPVFTPGPNDVVTHKTSDKNIIGEPVIKKFELSYYQGGQNYSKPYIYTLNDDKTEYVRTQTGDNPAGVTVNAPQSINASDIKISWTADGTFLFKNAKGSIKGNGQPSSLASDKNGGTKTVIYTKSVNDQFDYPKYSAVVDSSSVNWPIYGKGPVIHSYPSVYIYGAEANGYIPSVNSDVTDLKAALGDASKLVDTRDLTADHNSEFSSVNWQNLPSLDKANAQAPATVRINFTDGSYLDVPVHVNVIKVDQGVDDKTNHDIYRDITRTINVEGESTPVVQHVIYSRAKITDLSKPAGQQVTYTKWTAVKNSEGQPVTKFPQYEVTKPGYTATATGATIETVDGKQYVPVSATITPDSPNETVDVTYEHTQAGGGQQGGNPIPTPEPGKRPENPDDKKPTDDKKPEDKTPEKKDDTDKKVTHHKKVSHRKAKGYNHNNNAKGEQTPGYNENNGVHGEGYGDNTGVHGEGNNNIGVHGTDAANAGDKNAKTLPQTGEKQDRASIIGLALASIAGLLGLGVDRKRKHN